MTFTLARVTKVIGVNSNLANGKHILMWDFDNTTLDNVMHDLREVQSLYDLPEIRIVCTRPDTNYIAYCFKQFDWLDAVRVVVNTDGVDKNFIKYGVYREHWTLRVTPKSVILPKFATILKGYEKPDCSPSDLLSWVRYETLLE